MNVADTSSLSVESRNFKVSVVITVNLERAQAILREQIALTGVYSVGTGQSQVPDSLLLSTHSAGLGKSLHLYAATGISSEM